uniref:Uncharacterized protein n=1 Tax=Nicotiana tabacum TaxID=4097 RepID=A0A1S3XHI7_TOBAC|nr:PREDICTED: uncharacterized protein LOC107765204 [Nicotiana tabacum]
MAEEQKQQTTTTAMEMREMRALIETLFRELNARQDKFDQTIQQLKEYIESSTAQEKPAMNASSASCGNSSMLQEENMKGRGKTLTTTEHNKRRAKGLRLFCDEKCSNKERKDVVGLPTDDDEIDPITSEKEDAMLISIDAVVEYPKPYQSICVTGYHGNRPLNILIGTGTTHNFIDSSMAAKLGCDTFPIKPRSVKSVFGNVMVTSRACNNFQLLLQGTLFSMDLHLLPLSTHCDMVLGGKWIRTLGMIKFDSKGVEFYFQGKKHLLCYNGTVEGSKR